MDRIDVMDYELFCGTMPCERIAKGQANPPSTPAPPYNPTAKNSPLNQLIPFPNTFTIISATTFGMIRLPSQPMMFAVRARRRDVEGEAAFVFLPLALLLLARPATRTIDAPRSAEYIIFAVLKLYIQNTPNSEKYTVVGRVYPSVRDGKGEEEDDRCRRSARVFSAMFCLEGEMWVGCHDEWTRVGNG